MRKNTWWVGGLLGIAIVLAAGRAEALPECSAVCRCQISCSLPCTIGVQITCGLYTDGHCGGNCPAAASTGPAGGTREQQDQAFLQSLRPAAPATAAGFPPAEPRAVQPLCGPVCDTGYLMPPSGSTLASGTTCSEATTNLQNVLIASANDECQIDTGRNSCDTALHITAPCYQYQGGTLYYVGGYLAYGCRDTTC